MGKKKSASWCDDSVARLFFLRYKTELANRFDSKNNNQKKEAYEMSSALLSIGFILPSSPSNSTNNAREPTFLSELTLNYTPGTQDVVIDDTIKNIFAGRSSTPPTKQSFLVTTAPA
ncbi:hypothetical protein H257_06875 [Aphanomyces astaci]|uniref:Uncharacterized protein n=1 Tax=Aphanomyces astaci TaxID=112090 RepID=W4GIU7_APHAT|nr:hypothetical protein H257_06875 [Aphanomyces astaci]ETV79615.1 hypothetical protein H257_06875 [Aphanomyces astaci]|eukprot:XP_009830551.1 hypothetical protein H257_06875 [Aphanomyces astaci]